MTFELPELPVPAVPQDTQGASCEPTSPYSEAASNPEEAVTSMTLSEVVRHVSRQAEAELLSLTRGFEDVLQDRINALECARDEGRSAQLAADKLQQDLRAEKVAHLSTCEKLAEMRSAIHESEIRASQLTEQLGAIQRRALVAEQNHQRLADLLEARRAVDQDWENGSSELLQERDRLLQELDGVRLALRAKDEEIVSLARSGSECSQRAQMLASEHESALSDLVLAHKEICHLHSRLKIQQARHGESLTAAPLTVRDNLVQRPRSVRAG